MKKMLIALMLALPCLTHAQSNAPNAEFNTQPNSALDATSQTAAPTLAELHAPTNAALSEANTELLTKNAELTRKVDDLTTQVNVLAQERSGQLFIYGAMTAGTAMFIGLILAKLVSRQRW